MANFREDIKTIRDELVRQRETLALQIHLAKADARDEWEKLEKKWVRFSVLADNVMSELKDSGKDVEEDLKILSSDLADHYEKLKKMVK